MSPGHLSWTHAIDERHVGGGRELSWMGKKESIAQQCTFLIIDLS